MPPQLPNGNAARHDRPSGSAKISALHSALGLVEYDPFGPPPTSFSLQLKAARIAAGLTRRQLAARLRVHLGTVADWERRQARPLQTLVQRIEATLGVSLEAPPLDRDDHEPDPASVLAQKWALRY
jgi:DNA-binding transcriptional regulator YiaG